MPRPSRALLALLAVACSDYELDELQPRITVSPEALSFDGTALGTSEVQQLTMGNLGEGELDVASVAWGRPLASRRPRRGWRRAPPWPWT